MQVLCTFTFNTETKEAAVAGNVTIQDAARILQDLAVVYAVQSAMEEAKTQKPKTKIKMGKQKTVEVMAENEGDGESKPEVA